MILLSLAPKEALLEAKNIRVPETIAVSRGGCCRILCDCHSGLRRLPFVLAFRQKYTTEPRPLRCRILTLTYRYNKLRVDAEGAT
jgi:hypothetical protein